MNFTKATYRKARLIAISDLHSRADILEWAKSNLQSLGTPVFGTHWEHMEQARVVDEARDEYFKALETATRIVARGRREKGLWPR